MRTWQVTDYFPGAWHGISGNYVQVGDAPVAAPQTVSGTTVVITAIIVAALAFHVHKSRPR